MTTLTKTTTLAETADRVSFDLSYRRSPERRRFTADGLLGPELDNAYDPDGEPVPGEWLVPDWSGVIEVEAVGTIAFQPPAEDDRDWIWEFFCAAMNEGIHEVLEWFRVDGELLLDPHGGLIDDIAVMAAEQIYQRAIERRTAVGA